MRGSIPLRAISGLCPPPAASAGEADYLVAPRRRHAALSQQRNGRALILSIEPDRASGLLVHMFWLTQHIIYDMLDVRR